MQTHPNSSVLTAGLNDSVSRMALDFLWTFYHSSSSRQAFIKLYLYAVSHCHQVAIVSCLPKHSTHYRPTLFVCALVWQPEILTSRYSSVNPICVACDDSNAQEKRRRSTGHIKHISAARKCTQVHASAEGKYKQSVIWTVALPAFTLCGTECCLLLYSSKFDNTQVLICIVVAI